MLVGYVFVWFNVNKHFNQSINQWFDGHQVYHWKYGSNMNLVGDTNSRLPITQTSKGTGKRFELSGVQVTASGENWPETWEITLTMCISIYKVNCGDGEGMQVQCTLHFKGHKKIIDLLKKELSSKVWWNLNNPELDWQIFLHF